MKKYRFFILFFLTLFILQFSFLPLIAVHGVIPDLLVLATVSSARQCVGKLRWILVGDHAGS